MNKKLYLIVLISLFSSAAAIAQTTLDVNFNALGFLDNREYKDFVARSRTYSGTRTALDFGLNVDSLNSFVVGANAIHEFGAQPFFLTVDPIAYYKFQNKNWLFHIGEFPRQGLLDDYPRALLNDTLRYFRPNVQGMLVRYDNNLNFKETFWLDWVSRQTETAREQFLFGMSGKYSPFAKGPFYISHYFLLLHDAGSASDANAITDNGGAQIRFGLDFSHKTFLDSLAIEAGGMTSIERTRGLTGLHLPKGVVASAYLSWHWIALYDEFYKGQGSHIFYGDAFYQRTTYNRLDFIFTSFSAQRLKGQFIFSVHRTPGYTSNQEAFRLTYDLGRRVIARFKD